jgi:hypothetical protein
MPALQGLVVETRRRPKVVGNEDWPSVEYEHVLHDCLRSARNLEAGLATRRVEDDGVLVVSQPVEDGHSEHTGEDDVRRASRRALPDPENAGLALDRSDVDEVASAAPRRDSPELAADRRVLDAGEERLDLRVTPLGAGDELGEPTERLRRLRRGVLALEGAPLVVERHLPERLFCQAS